MQVEYRVNSHPSGRLTLTERTQKDMQPHDCKGDLLGNMDAGKFYKAVAIKLYEAHVAGHEIQYTDASHEG